MDKTVFCEALALMAIPAFSGAPSAMSSLLSAPLQSHGPSWPFLAFVGVTVLGAIAAIIWEMHSD